MTDWLKGKDEIDREMFATYSPQTSNNLSALICINHCK